MYQLAAVVLSNASLPYQLLVLVHCVSPVAQLGQGKNIAVALIGKVKTVAQMTAIIALLLWEPAIPGVATPLVGIVALWIAAILTLWSMFHYLKLAAPHLGAND